MLLGALSLVCEHRLLDGSIQKWRFQDFPDGGKGANLKGRASNYYFGHFFQKTAWIERNRPRDRYASLAASSPPGSANGLCTRDDTIFWTF